ncbi:MAG: BTAD domain-containing putative transcriptional regulator [Caulobacteraceae bacterium]
MLDPDLRPGAARLRLMGAFRLAGPRGKSVAIGSRRARALLAYLHFAPDQRATRERLCGLLWSDRGEAQARASLRQCLLELRDALTAAGLDLVAPGREDVALRAGVLGSDVVDLERALSGADAGAAASALVGVGSARLLDDLEIGGLYRDWLDHTRVRLDQLIAAGVLSLLGRLEAEADWPKARRLAEAFLHRDPLDEAVVAAAIRADIALGAASAAHRRFRILQAALAKEFGVSPGAATREALTPKANGRNPATAFARSARAAGAPTKASGDAPPLVIVAAFEAGESSGSQAALPATLREEVLSGLSRFRDLRVITDPRPLDQVASDASAERADAYALGGSLRTSGNEGRFIVQLLRSGERHVIWSGRFALSGVNLVGTIDDIIAQVVGAVLPTIDADLVRKPSNLPADPSYQRYLLARDAALRARNFEEARSAANQLEAMVTIDRSFALPYLPLAYLYNTDFGYTRAGSSGAAERARAFDLAKSALALDRGHVHGYTVAGWCHLRRRQWVPARVHLEQALALNPFHATRVMEAAFGFIFLGEMERARGLLDRCLLLNPTPDDEFFRDLGLLEMVRRNHELADSYFDLIAHPTIWVVVYAAMNAQMAGAAFEQRAKDAAERISVIWPDETAMTTETVVAWIASHHPFQAAETEDFFLRAARQAWSAILPPPTPEP